MKSGIVISLYLLAVVAANLAVSTFGPTALVVTAWILIPFDMTTKDALQEHWAGNRLVLRMGALILAGALLTYWVNAGAGPVALASFLAFTLSTIADSLIYHFMRGRPRLHRVNGSNIASAIVDSTIFPLVAFGAMSPWLTVSQAGAKFLGGAIWGLILTKTIWREHAQHG